MSRRLSSITLLALSIQLASEGGSGVSGKERRWRAMSDLADLAGTQAPRPLPACVAAAAIHQALQRKQHYHRSAALHSAPPTQVSVQDDPLGVVVGHVGQLAHGA